MDLQYFPKKDKIEVSTNDDLVECFNKEAKFKGTMRLEPVGMSGKGSADFVGAKLSSKNFKLRNRKMLADTSAFELKSNPGDVGLAFKTDNVNADVDFDARKGQFKSNSGETKIEFPTNLYVCFMDQLTWFMDKSEMELSSSMHAENEYLW